MRSAWKAGVGRIKPEQLSVNPDGSKRDVQVVDGAFDDFSNAEQVGVKQGEVDGVLIAQAWHWCPDYDKALVSAGTSHHLYLLVFRLCITGRVTY
jgi:hypothetical protein